MFYLLSAKDRGLPALPVRGGGLAAWLLAVKLSTGILILADSLEIDPPSFDSLGELFFKT